MSEQQRETAFLRQVILYDDTAERHKLEERITQAQRDERCVRRALGLMALLTALAMAGLCYAAVFLTDYPHNMTRLMTPFFVKVFCALGVGSLICLLAFAGLEVVYRKELEQRREECRRLATKLLESRLGKPRAMPLSGVLKEQELMVNHSKAVVSESEIVTLPRELGSH
jgi:Ni/Fe-hydrogenase subunit HybB-like protein